MKYGYSFFESNLLVNLLRIKGESHYTVIMPVQMLTPLNRTVAELQINNTCLTAYSELHSAHINNTSWFHWSQIILRYYTALTNINKYAVKFIPKSLG